MIGIDEAMLSDDGNSIVELDGTFLHSVFCQNFFVLSMLLLIELLFDEL